jgi:hypothetical protein
MDQQHPIPQDVTGFQFKLIGDMTVKQFAYLAAGVILAWLTYSLPIFWLVKWPLVGSFVMLGVALAFIPIEGRPFDVMLTNFLKALISPNQYVFQKTGYPLIPYLPPAPKMVVKPAEQKQQAQQQSADKLQKYLRTIHTTQQTAMDEKEQRFLGSLGLPLAAPAVSQSKAAPSAVFQPDVSTRTVTSQPIPESNMRTVGTQPLVVTPQEQQAAIPLQPIPQQKVTPEEEAIDEQTSQTLEKEAAVIQQELSVAKQEEQQQSVAQNAPMTAVAHAKVVELEKELADILDQKTKLQNQLITLKKELAAQKQKVFTPSVGVLPQTTQNVRTIPQGGGKAAGLLAAPDVPNLLTGIIKDARGNTLPNILIEVKDTDENPVRAFKTNGLGQFAAATPLANGTYTITFEDPNGKQKFDAVQLVVTGAIISPLEINSIDEREQLRKELFNG